MSCLLEVIILSREGKLSQRAFHAFTIQTLFSSPEISNLLVTVNSSCNIFIYTIFGEKFQRQLCLSVRRFCRCCLRTKDDDHLLTKSNYYYATAAGHHQQRKQSTMVVERNNVAAVCLEMSETAGGANGRKSGGGPAGERMERLLLLKEDEEEEETKLITRDGKSAGDNSAT